VVLTGTSITGVLTHWQRGRTMPCAGKSCWCHEENIPARWKGYISCIRAPGGVEALLELTENAAQQLVEQTPDARDFRGIKCRVKRRTNKPTAPLDVVLEEFPCPIKLPPAVDPIPLLLRVWGLRLSWTQMLPGLQPTDPSEEIPS